MHFRWLGPRLSNAPEAARARDRSFLKCQYDEDKLIIFFVFQLQILLSCYVSTDPANMAKSARRFMKQLIYVSFRTSERLIKQNYKEKRLYLYAACYSDYIFILCKKKNKNNRTRHEYETLSEQYVGMRNLCSHTRAFRISNTDRITTSTNFDNIWCNVGVQAPEKSPLLLDHLRL